MKIKRILAASLAAMTLGLALTGCSNSGGADDNTIVVGLDVGFAPMGFEQDGEIVGFDIDLARAVIEDKMGMTVQFQPIDWDSKEGELNTGKIDLIWNGLSRSPEREEQMLANLTECGVRCKAEKYYGEDQSFGGWVDFGHWDSYHRNTDELSKVFHECSVTKIMKGNWRWSNGF